MTGNVKGAVRGKNVTFGNFAYNDDFSEKTLPLDWFSLRGPVDSICSTNAVPGYLSMKCVETTTAEKAVPAYVGAAYSIISLSALHVWYSSLRL